MSVCIGFIIKLNYLDGGLKKMHLSDDCQFWTIPFEYQCPGILLEVFTIDSQN